MPRHIAFLSMADLEDFIVYDRLAIPALEARGFTVEEVPWQSTVDWNRFAAVVIRSTWDYQQHHKEFLTVLEQIEASKAVLLNDVDTVRWNIDKAYMLQLAEQGLPVIPTILGQGMAAAQQQQVRDFCARQKAVIKPRVGAGAFGAFVLEGGELPAEVIQYHQQADWLLQPFVESIHERGEFSLFYFGGEFSHGVQKLPKAGDFRSQEEYGSSLSSYPADTQMRELGLACLSAAPRPVFQARVDLVEFAPGDLRLMELELIEPSLYFPFDSQSPLRFAKALEHWLGELQVREDSFPET